MAARMSASSAPAPITASPAASAASARVAALRAQAISAGLFTARSRGTRSDASDERHQAAERRVDGAAVGGGQAMGVVLDAEPPAAEPEVDEQIAEPRGGMLVTAVHPDANVVEEGSVARLAKVGRPGDQRHAAVGAQNQALEETVAERIVAGQPIHALLGEEEHAHRGAVPPWRPKSARAAPRTPIARNAGPSTALCAAAWAGLERKDGYSTMAIAERSRP